MIVVSSLRRSGSSMLMFALKEAGLDILGDKYFNETEQKKEGNLNGYWEVDDICTNTGLQEKMDGEAIKIMFEALSSSKPELIDKLVFIFRQPRKMLSSVYKYNHIEHKDIFICKQAVDIIDALSWTLYYNKQFRIFFYEDIIAKPRQEMKRLIKFTGGDSKKAIKVIDKNWIEWKQLVIIVNILICLRIFIIN